MNVHIINPLKWDSNRQYKSGRVLTVEQLENIDNWGRYRDVDDDGIPYRTLPITYPEIDSYFTKGSSHDEDAIYSEDSSTYVRIMERLKKNITRLKRLFINHNFSKPQINLRLELFSMVRRHMQ